MGFVKLALVAPDAQFALDFGVRIALSAIVLRFLSVVEQSLYAIYDGQFKYYLFAPVEFCTRLAIQIT